MINTYFSRSTGAQATALSQLPEVVEYMCDATIGFAGTVFKIPSEGVTDVDALHAQDGITAGDLTVNMRSTNFADDAAADNQANDGQGAGLSVYDDTASSTGKSAILKFSGNLANQITIRNFDETATKRTGTARNCYKTDSYLRRICRRCSAKTLLITGTSRACHA